MATTAFATCPLCEAICGLAVDVEDNRITRIRGDAQDPLSRGYLCPKGAALAEVQHDPDRLRTPLRRRGTSWEPLGWDEALDEIADRMARLQSEQGRDAVAVFIGNPTAHSYSALLAGQVLLKALRTRNVYTSNSVDAWPRLFASLELYGSQAAIPIPDLDSTAFLLVLGANPVVSNGSLMTAPACRRRLQELRERGARLVVVDPRRTETAALADEHHFIRPGTDAFLLLGLLHALFAERLTVETDRRLDGLDRLAALAAPFPPESVAKVTGIGAGAIRSLARAFAAAPSAVCYGRMGTCTQEFGALTTWLIDALNAVTGNLDRRGGAMFPRPAVDLAGLAARLGQAGHFGRWCSRVAGLPEFSGELPVAALAEEIETPGPGRIRALLTHAGNPVLSIPNGRRLEKALESLELMISIDIYLNETTRFAHFILPPTFGLEHDHYPLFFHALAVRNTAHYSPALLTPEPGARHDWQILLGLASRLCARSGLRGRLAAFAIRRLAACGPRRLLALLLRLGPWGKGPSPFGRGVTLRALLGQPHGIDLGPLEPRLDDILRTEDRRIRLVPPRMEQDLGRLAARLTELEKQAARTDDKTLFLLGRRELRSNNSWMHNSPGLVAGRERCTLLIHPDDARRLGVSDGDRVRLASRIGSVTVRCHVSEEMMPGVVSLPHGWGHHRDGVRLAVATQHAGVSLNDLTDDQRLDRLSGTSDVNGVPVRVERA